MMSNASRTLYTGVTNDLVRRVFAHKQKFVPGFTRKYNITRLVHFEVTSDVLAAIAREKQIKGWLRKKKIDLIESNNPEWKDLSESWYKECHPEASKRPKDLHCIQEDPSSSSYYGNGNDGKG